MSRTRGSIPPRCCNLAIGEKDETRFIRMMKAAGNPLRFQILKFLVTHPGCITGKIVDHLPIAQATVSQHLKVLREAGWIKGEVDGPAVCYELSPENTTWFRALVERVF